MSDQRLRIGIVGCGGIAAAHIDAYKVSGAAEIVATCDVDENRAKALAEKVGGKGYSRLEEMLEKEKPDAVSLLTPPSIRMPVTRILCDHKVHVFSEKPLADTVKVAKQMAKAAERNGVLLMVAACHRFHEPVRRTRELIENGTMGQVKTFRNRFGYRCTATDDEVRGRGGVLLDNGAHSVYLFRFLAGEPVRVMARGDRADDITLLRDCIMLLETAEGRIGVIELNGTVPKTKNIIEVYGTGGAAYIDYGGGESAFYAGSSNEKLILTDPSLSGSHRFHREIAHFIACIRGQEKPRIGAEEGIRDLMVIEAAFKSIQKGGAVKIG